MGNDILMKTNVVKVISMIFIGLLSILSAYLLKKNLSIGIAFLSKSFMLFVFIVLVIFIVISIKEKLKTPYLLMIIVVIYLIFSIVPTFKFYIDLLECNSSNYSEYVGVVDEISVSGLITIVEIDGRQFFFHGPFESSDLDLGKNTQISFLKRSKIAVSYEIIVN